jgi:hypothetical protein
LVTAYHSFAGEVEASNTPTIRRLTPSRRHQLSSIALEIKKACDVRVVFENFYGGVLPVEPVIADKHDTGEMDEIEATEIKYRLWWPSILRVSDYVLRVSHYVAGESRER